ncbi:YceI family protein [Labedaea rhizosphaerae]|uniref:Polyisoprenoid-binding protein YceI n=1 Tax=Labedaea rhizosphaerae TaxID=598644 RepID=A0A4R6RZZ0_LABRH|nr:YceI family protein [Labedaea rhizosphaerae]TDP92792.1 polyisoprenoid-binding protein YceI [Labedaea rhizosphaerae]
MTSTAPAVLAEGRWTADLARSTATFTVGNLGKTVTGTVPVLDGTVDVDAQGLPCAVRGTLDLGAVDTGNRRRDKDLRKPKLLDLDQHPVMTFVADEVITGADGWSVTGKLTARGTTIGLTGHVTSSTVDGAVTLTARTSLDRRALGVRAPRFMIGHTVDITVVATIQLGA